MKEIKEVDPKYLDFERDNNIYEYHPKRVRKTTIRNILKLQNLMKTWGFKNILET